MLHSVLLALHITAGLAGLVLGPVAVAAARHPGHHGLAGVAYQAAVVAVTLTALGLVALAPTRLWGLGVIAVATSAAALAGGEVRRRRRPGWLPVHIRLMGGSYLSLVTAALVVSWSSPLAWILPTMLGAPLIAAAVHRSAAPAGRTTGAAA